VPPLSPAGAILPYKRKKGVNPWQLLVERRRREIGSNDFD
jgi:hypothetical protein